MIRKEDGAGQIPCYPTAKVNDGQSDAASQLLNVSHHKELETNRYHQVEQSVAKICNLNLANIVIPFSPLFE